MRRPLEARLLDLIETHPRAATLSAEAAYAWLRLGRATDKSGELDTLRLRPGLATLGELARAFRLSVTEAARGLDELIRKGCLLVIEGGFRLPAWTGVASRKAVSARENGRKHVGSAVAAPTQQRRLPLLASLAGGAGSVTQSVTHATTTTKTLSSKEEEVVGSVTEASSVTDAAAIAEQLGQLAGLTSAQTCRSFGQVEVWLRQGLSAETLREAVGRVLRRPHLPVITGLSYFDGAVMDAHRSAPPAPALTEARSVDPVEQRARRAWQVRICAWRDNGCVGPMPRLEHFIGLGQQAVA